MCLYGSVLLQTIKKGKNIGLDVLRGNKPQITTITGVRGLHEEILQSLISNISRVVVRLSASPEKKSSRSYDIINEILAIKNKTNKGVGSSGGGVYVCPVGNKKKERNIRKKQKTVYNQNLIS